MHDPPPRNAITMHDSSGALHLFHVSTIFTDHSFYSFILGPVTDPQQILLDAESNSATVMRMIRHAAAVCADTGWEVVRGHNSGSLIPLYDPYRQLYFFALHRFEDSFRVSLHTPFCIRVFHYPLSAELNQNLHNIHRLTYLSRVFYIPGQDTTP